ALIGRRQEEPHNLSIQKEILDVLCQLVSINESQKLVVGRLREERDNERPKHEKQNDLHKDEGKEDIDLLCDEQLNHDAQDHEGKISKEPPLEGLTQSCKSSPNVLGTGVSTPPYSDYTEEGQVASLDDYFEEPAVCGVAEEANDSSLLTVRECEEVLAKRYERRKRNAYSHIFSSTIWEKPETRRKRRAWLTSGAGSPPTLRRKVRPPSQPPSQPQSRPVSPTQSSCSPLTTCPPSQPASPQSLEDEFSASSQPSEEICPMCKIKGADVQCDGCGVIYHGQCVDLGDADPPPCWLCLTCEQLGLRASTNNDPQHHSRRREALAVREQLLRQRAELTIAKLQLEERKQHLANALEAQCSERSKLQNKEDGVRSAIHQLQDFIFTFQKSGSPQASSPNVPTHWNESASVTTSPASTSSRPFMPGLTISRSSSPSQTSQASSPGQASTKIFMPNLTISCATSPSQASSPRIMPSLTISRSSSPCQASPRPLTLSQTISRSSSPSQISSHASSPSQVFPQTFLPGLGISPSSSPNPSYYSRHKLEKKHQVEAKGHCQNVQNILKLHSKNQKREAKLHTLTHQSESDLNSQPTDLSTSTHSRQNGIPGFRKGDGEAMAASL
ncbi:PHD finger protein 21A-like, partial [Homarus americanus]